MKKSAYTDEMLGQPAAILDTWEYFAGDDGKELLKIKEYINNYAIHKFILTGLGSSYFAANVAYYMLTASGIDCELRDSGEFLLFQMTETVPMGTAIIFISQSGESGEILELLKKVDQIQWPKTHIWAITNNPDSTLGKFAGCKLLLQAGTETAATTKTYVTTILVSWLLATAIIQEPNFSDRMREMMKKNVGFIEEFMKTGEESGKKMADFLGDLNRISCIGRGTSIATAQQAALNFKEIPKIGSEALTGSMFVHGSIELIDKDFRAVVIENNPVTTELNIKMVKNILTKWGGGKCIVITNQKEEWEKFKQELAEKDAAEQQSDTPAGDGTQAITPETPKPKLNDKLMVIYNPIYNQFLAPLYEIVVLEYLFIVLAERRGYDTANYRNSEKVTKF